MRRTQKDATDELAASERAAKARLGKIGRIRYVGQIGLAAFVTPVVATPAFADTGFATQHHVAIFGGGINPWTGGHALNEAKEFSARTPDFRIKIDPELSPLPALAQALGVPFEPPRIGYADLSGEVHGRAAFNFGYSFGAGELSLVYPMSANIRLDSRADSDLLAAGYTIVISTSFEPGLPRPLSRPLCGSGSVAGCTVSESARTMLANVHRPDFQTTFADARAYADFEYDVGVGVAATVGIAKVGNLCFSCFSKRFKIHDERVVPLIDVSPQSVLVAGLGSQTAFPATFPTPYGSIYANLPQPRVSMERMEGAGMSGEEEPTIIAFEAAVEKLVPILGPFLSNNLGPLGYTLLETQGGPSLNLIQSFRFSITPMVTLRFSHPVQLEQNPGKRHHELHIPLGQSVRIVAPEEARGPFSITPVYWLEGHVKNSTKLALGIGVTARVLKLSLAGVNAGPFGQERFHQPQVIGAELCCEEYPLSLASVTAPAIKFNLAGTLEGYASDRVTEGGFDGLRQSHDQGQEARGDQRITDFELQQPRRPEDSPIGDERIGDQGIRRDGPSGVPPVQDPGSVQIPPTQPDGPFARDALPSTIDPGRLRRGPLLTSPGQPQPVRRLSPVRGQNMANSILGGRNGEVDLGTSPSINDDGLVVYVAGIPHGGMRTMSATPSSIIRPRDMTPRVLEALKDVSELQDVSTTNKDPRIIDAPTRQ